MTTVLLYRKLRQLLFWHLFDVRSPAHLRPTRPLKSLDRIPIFNTINASPLYAIRPPQRLRSVTTTTSVNAECDCGDHTVRYTYISADDGVVVSETTVVAVLILASSFARSPAEDEHDGRLVEYPHSTQ